MISKRILFIVLMNVIGIVGWKIGYSNYLVNLDRYPVENNVIFWGSNIGYYLVWLIFMLAFYITEKLLKEAHTETNSYEYLFSQFLRWFSFSMLNLGLFSLMGNFNLPIYSFVIPNLLWLLGIFIFDIFHNVFETTKLPSPISIFYCDLLSKIKVLSGGHPLWIIPKDKQESSQQTKMSNSTYLSILDNLKYTPVSNAKKQIFKSQCYQILTNINKAIWKLHRTEQLRSIINSNRTYNESRTNEVTRLVEKITQEINKSLDVLSLSATNLLKVEVSHGDLLFDQLLRNLNESNNRLKNISSVYQDAKGRI